ncbi:hypothetical protein NOGI109294_15240 [Nocardiopsis gilva]|uniref:hypothetical protein n=1 Tax=Nocardiopsis gilva TaxID=280236 RepID=UPI0003456572|nr:hypothetical protein [Nocardiopsis gilva]
MPDEPTLWELQRTIQAGYRELSADIQALNSRLDQYVLKEVYEARRDADLVRIARLETELATARETTRKALLTALTSFIAPIVVGIVLAVVLGGGGP